MGWPYQFVSLSHPEKQERRLALDRAGLFAQLSALLPVVIFFGVRLFSWAATKTGQRRVVYEALPKSPVLKHHTGTFHGSRKVTARRIIWWLGDDVIFAGRRWGRRDQAVFGIAWTVWLLSLCIVGTGNDYFHLTKRFGIVAASQFPIQYLLSLKYINPVAYAFGTSHEVVNRWHRVLGRIIYFLLCLHGAFYMNYWIQTSIVGKKVVELVGVTGISSLIGMTLLNSTALAVVRRQSYRLFFITHLMVSFAIPPAIFFHVPHARAYMTEALAVFVMDLVVRKATTVKARAMVEIIPGTDLIKVVAKVPSKKAAHYFDHPGAHVYVNIPPAARPSQNPLSMDYVSYDFIYNPFTVASADEDSGEITLVARQQKGPLTRVLAKQANITPPDVRMPLCIEGPYGVATSFPDLAGMAFDKVLLVAGGVGATFIIPIYRHIISENPAAHVDMVWAVRKAAEATWPATGTEKSVIDDGRIRLFLTGNILDSYDRSASPSGAGDQVEMVRMSPSKRCAKSSLGSSSRRPDLQKIVDDVFRHGYQERVAIIVCGPDGMARQLRKCVGVWVKKGRDVWFHAECFSW